MSNKIPDLEPHSWHLVGRGWWLHTQQATMRMRYAEHRGYLTNQICGQGSTGAYSSSVQDPTYIGPILEFRYCNEGWSYSLAVPCTEEGFEAMCCDLGAVGLPVCDFTYRQFSSELQILEARRRKGVSAF